jgi:hypothetical protein
MSFEPVPHAFVGAVEDFAAASPSDLTALLTLVLAEAKESDYLIPDRYVPLLAAAKGVRMAFIGFLWLSCSGANTYGFQSCTRDFGTMFLKRP